MNNNFLRNKVTRVGEIAIVVVVGIKVYYDNQLRTSGCAVFMLLFFIRWQNQFKPL